VFGEVVIMGLDDELTAHIDAIRGTVAGSSAVIGDIVARLYICFEQGGKLLVCGNGGSAADAQHLAAEFMNRMRIDREPWPAIALTTDSSVLTSIANDAAYDDVFARQIGALGRPGDVLIALSTSGGSRSVLAALSEARQRGMVTVGFTGEAGAERMGEDCDLLLAVPSRDTARIQECHEFVYHVIAGMVEGRMVERANGTQGLELENRAGRR
jgi:D-sedoheptulose 7-phosphate isomerase